MDADLYEHLKNTITNHPNELQPTDHPDNDKQDLSQGQGSPDPESATSKSDNTRRPRSTSSSLPEEMGQVVHAISSSQWAARLGNLMGTVKKQVLIYGKLIWLTSIRARPCLRQLKTRQARNLKMFDLDLLSLLLLTPLLPMSKSIDSEILTPLLPTRLNTDQANRHHLLEFQAASCSHTLNQLQMLLKRNLPLL